MRPSVKSKYWSTKTVLQGVSVGLVCAAIIWGLTALRLFTNAQLSSLNFYYVPATVADKIALVALDDDSLALYGRSPALWPRKSYIELVNFLSAAKARVLAFDIMFAEAAEGDDELAAALRAARQSVNRMRIVMPIVGTQLRATQGDSQRVIFDNALRPQAIYRAVADYLGYVNGIPDSDGYIRRQTSLLEVAGEEGLNFSLAVYLAYLRLPASAVGQALTTTPNAIHILGEKSLATYEYGLWYQNYFGPPATENEAVFPTYSFKDVVNGKIPAEAFQDKIVLLGLMNSTGAEDRFPVPIDARGQTMTGLEIHANALETLLQNQALKRQSEWEKLLLIVLIAVLVAVPSRLLAWYWGPVLAVAAILCWVWLASTHFIATREMINPFLSLAAIILPALANIGIQINVEVNRRQKTEFLLESVVQASQQQLELDKILVTIAADVGRLLQTEHLVIWLRNAQGLYPAYRSDSLSKVSTQELSLQQNLETAEQYLTPQRQLVTPMHWQGQLVGVITAEVGGDLSSEKRQVLAGLAERIAPSVENAMLYAETQQQNSRLRALLDNTPVGILIVNRKLVVSNFNAAAQAALGAGTNLSQPLMQVLGESGLEAVTRNRLQLDIQRLQPLRYDIKLGDHAYVLEGAYVPNTGEWVIVLSNVTPLVELSDLRTRMVRLASHDLKNPLMGVQGYANLMLEGIGGSDFTEKDRGYLHDIMASSEHMMQIINDVLNLERSRSGQGQFTALPLAQIVPICVEHLRRDIEQNQQNCTLEVVPNLPTVLGDERQLTQAFTNLIGNAVKYTPQNGKIWVRLYQQAEYVRFEVQDTGYGIPADQHSKIFLEFSRVRTSKTKHIPGTGLGLSLVKSIIQAHGGRVGFTSQEGEGSIFYADLPMMAKETAV